MDLIHHFGLRVVGQQLAPQHVAVARNHGQQVVKVVRHAARQLTERLHFLRLVQLRFQFLFLRDVAYNTHEIALIVELELGDRQVERKRGTVLSQAFHLAPAADNLGMPGLLVVGKITVVFGVVGLGH